MKDKILIITPFLLLVFLFSCTPKDPSIRIDYLVPPSSTEFNGKVVSLKIADQREDKNILGPAAFGKFDKFNGKFSFAHKTKGAPLLGIYDAPQLFKEAIKTRLSKQGLKLVDPAKNIPELLIVIKTFSLEHKGSWKIKISLEAHLNIEGKLVSRERINTSSETSGFKSHGVEQLENSFSEIINKLNINRLFKMSKI